MRRIYLALLMAAVLSGGCATTGGVGERAVVRAKNKVIPALVHISPVKEVFSSGKREEFVVEGSGFIISPDGYVVTNEHVAGESKLVRCVLHNRDEVDAEVIGTDRFTDIALLKLKTDRKNLPTVKLGTSAKLQPGQTVLALGSPHGLARSVSKGIISVADRYLGEGGGRPAPYNNWIQTDAAINPGNSGGPLVNLKGDVIGINTRKLSGADNVGFAIPIDIAREVIEDLKEQGRVPRSWIGVSLQEMMRKTDDPKQPGVVIGDVEMLCPAREAGLSAGDVLVSVNGTPINARFAEDLPAVRKLIADLPVGEEAVFGVKRGEETLDVKVVTSEESDLKGREVEFVEWGFTASELTPDVVRRARLESSKGVEVTGTKVGAPARNGGLSKGDIIITMDGKEIENLAAFKTAYEALIAEEKPLVLLDVKRGALTRYLLIKGQAEENREYTGDEAEEGDGSYEE